MRDVDDAWREISREKNAKDRVKDPKVSLRRTETGRERRVSQTEQFEQQFEQQFELDEGKNE